MRGKNEAVLLRNANQNAEHRANSYEHLNDDLQFPDMLFGFVATSILKSLSDRFSVAPIKLN